jgi:hypothetical protein
MNNSVNKKTEPWGPPRPPQGPVYSPTGPPGGPSGAFFEALLGPSLVPPGVLLGPPLRRSRAPLGPGPHKK